MFYVFAVPDRTGAVLIGVFGTLGLICLQPILVMNTCIAELRRAPSKFVRFRALLTALQTATLLVYALWALGFKHTHPEGHLCGPELLLVCAEALETGITLSQLAQATHLLFIVRNPFRPDRHNRKIAGAIWLLTFAEPVIVASILWPKTSVASVDPHFCLGQRMISLFSEARQGLAGVDLGFVVLALAVSILLLARLKTGLAVSEASRQRVSHQLFTFAVGYSLMDFISLMMQVTGASSRALAIVCLRGVWDMGVWVVANRAVLFPKAPCRQRGSSGQLGEVAILRTHDGQRGQGAKQGQQHQQRGKLRASRHDERLDIAEELRNELVLLTAHGIAKCISDTWLQAAVRKNKALPQNGPTRRNKKINQGTGAYSRRGWMTSVRASVRPSRLPGAFSSRSVAGGPGGSGGGGGGGGVCRDDCGGISLKDLSTGTPSVTSDADGTTESGGDSYEIDLEAADTGRPRHASFVERVRAASLSVAGMSTTGGLHPAISVPGLDAKHMDFFDYATETFAAIRRALGLSPDEYAQSFSAVQRLISEYAAHDRHNGFREILSSGASGQFFYFTPDKKYVVKTLSPREKANLLAAAPGYLAHCEAHPDTLIRYVGCHSIRMPLNTRKVYFVVMANVLPPQKCDLAFDLKGATSNRQRAKGGALEQLRTGARPPSSFKTLLDKDWMALQLKLLLPPPRAAELAARIGADADFLATQALMDYSLLVGVRLPPSASGRPIFGRQGGMAAAAGGAGGGGGGGSGAPSASDAASSSASDSGSAPGGGEDHGSAIPYVGQDGTTFYFGVIDVLEAWTTGCKWPIQEAVLKFVFRYVLCMQWYNPEGITAIPPAQYAARFEEFIAVHMLGLPYTSRIGKSWQPFW